MPALTVRVAIGLQSENNNTGVDLGKVKHIVVHRKCVCVLAPTAAVIKQGPSTAHEEMNAPHTSAGDVTSLPRQLLVVHLPPALSSAMSCSAGCLQHATFQGQTACSLARASTLPCWNWTRPQ